MNQPIILLAVPVCIIIDWGQRDSAVGKVLALHADVPGFGARYHL